MPYSNCLWLETVADIQKIHPDDVKADGTGIQFSVGSMIIITSPSGMTFFTCRGYEDPAPTERAGYVYVGVWSEINQGYPVFQKTIFTYSLAAFKHELLGSQYVYCASTDWTCPFYTYLKGQEIMFNTALYPTETPNTPEYTLNYNSTTAANFDEVSGSYLEWLTDRVSVEATESESGYFEYINTFTITYTAGLYYVNYCLRVGDYIVKPAIATSGTSIITTIYTYKWNGSTFAQIDSLALATVTSAGSGGALEEWQTASCDEGYCFLGLYLYTGSKASQGCIQAFYVDPSTGEITDNGIITESTAVRNGYFGHYLGIVTADIGSGDENILISCDEANNEVIALQMDGTFVDSYAFSRNDYMREVYRNTSASNGYFIAEMWDDSASVFRLCIFQLTSGGLSFIVQTSVAGATYLGGWVYKEISGSLYVLHYTSTYTFSIQYFNTSTGSPTTIDTYTLASGTYPYIYYSVRMYGNYLAFTRGRYVSPNYELWIEIWELDTTNNDFILVNDTLTADRTTMSNAATERSFPTYYSTGSYWAVLTSFQSHSHMWTSTGEISSYPGGTHIFYTASDDGALIVEDETTEITTATITTVIPSLSEIRFAISVDEGTTWQVWQSGVGYQSLSSVDDLATTSYGDISLFQTALQDLDLSSYKKIYFAFCMDRTDAGIDPLQTTSILHADIAVDAPSQSSYLLNMDTNGEIQVQINASSRVYYYNNTRLSLGFYDKMK